MTLLIADCCHIRGTVDDTVQKSNPQRYRAGAKCYCGKGTLRETTPAERALLALNRDLHQMIRDQGELIREATLEQLSLGGT